MAGSSRPRGELSERKDEWWLIGPKDVPSGLSHHHESCHHLPSPYLSPQPSNAIQLRLSPKNTFVVEDAASVARVPVITHFQPILVQLLPNHSIKMKQYVPSGVEGNKLKPTSCLGYSSLVYAW